ncbi:hypothetical protein NVS55_09775 [Myxococcus stipitatus]|uniref:hypothetical protein n=1 Tax=Myxococcus stipitatus TaxID=83455 RepID=UPI003144D859
MNDAENPEPGTDDRLRLSLEATFDQAVDLKRTLEPFLEVLEAHAGVWMPDVVEGRRRHAYSREAVLRALDEKRGKKGMSAGFSRATWPALDMSLRLWLPPAEPRLHVWVSVQPLSLFSDAGRCGEFVDMVRAWASLFPVTDAAANSLAEDQLAEPAPMSEGVSWLNVFGPRFVERVGLERVLSTPAHRVEQLPHGSVLLVLRPTAADSASDDARIAQARAQVHLRPELHFDTVLHALRARSAALAPVAPRFPPDLAPLLSRLPDALPISERPRRISELNAFRPPAPEEWLPAVLPLDVEDPERIRRDYGELSESLVAALHSHVPSLAEATPESLTDLDVYFWKENFPERYTRELIDEHTVPAVGAYLGLMLVRRLGGTWLPRKAMEESQVRIGERVWLPFLRARRYLRSRQSLLDCSLTQFFKEAERHRP